MLGLKIDDGTSVTIWRCFRIKRSAEMASVENDADVVAVAGDGASNVFFIPKFDRK